MLKQEIDKNLQDKTNLSHIYKYEVLTVDQLNNALSCPVFSNLLINQPNINDYHKYCICYYAQNKLGDIPKEIQIEIKRLEDIENKYISEILTNQEVDIAIERGVYLEEIFDYQALTQNQQDKLVCKIIDYPLIRNKDFIKKLILSQENINKIIERKRISLIEFLIKYQKLSLYQIDTIINNFFSFDIQSALLKYQKLSSRQINNCLALGGWEVIVKNCKYFILTEEQIERFFDESFDDFVKNGIDYGDLCLYQKLSKKQISKIIKKGRCLGCLLNQKNLTPRQKKKIDRFLDEDN